MIESFFRSLEEHEVDYLLISGQATVLYGAATFSEDIDLWLNPTDVQRAAFLSSLAETDARYYKLTPTFNVDLLTAGHGFHFILPAEPPIFIDVMGNPPRSRSFDEARADANDMDTPWGRIPTVGIKDLVEIKKTQRLGDYAVIGRLALRHLEGLAKPTAADFAWAVDNIYTLPELSTAVCTYEGAATVCHTIPALAPLAEQLAADEPSVEAEANAEQHLVDRILACQQRDRLYWRPIITRLRELRSGGELVAEGTVVTAP